MTGRLLTAVLVLLLLATAAFMIGSPWLKRDAVPDKLPGCPFLQGSDLSSLSPEVIAASGAYEAIRETLGRGSIDGVPTQAGLIERTFATSSPDIAKCAKRLGGEPDVESARRAFMRLNRLMEKHAAKPPHV